MKVGVMSWLTHFNRTSGFRFCGDPTDRVDARARGAACVACIGGLE
jgi:hypothetical protein